MDRQNSFDERSLVEASPGYSSWMEHMESFKYGSDPVPMYDEAWESLM